MVLGTDIKHCVGCQAGKSSLEMGVVEDKEVAVQVGCSVYPPEGQARWMRLGYCPHGNSGPNPPAESSADEKVRAGQQKQKKR